MKLQTVKNAKEEALTSGRDQYISFDFESNCYSFCTNRRGWIVGKVCLFYKDGKLESKFEEYVYPIRVIKTYKKIPVIAARKGNDNIFTILKNKDGKNNKLLFETREEVEEYIDRFDHYSSRDRKWFLCA